MRRNGSVHEEPCTHAALRASASCSLRCACWPVVTAERASSVQEFVVLSVSTEAHAIALETRPAVDRFGLTARGSRSGTGWIRFAARPATYAGGENISPRRVPLAGRRAQGRGASPPTAGTMQRHLPWAAGAWTSAPRPWHARPPCASRGGPFAVPCGPLAWPSAARLAPLRSPVRHRRPAGA